MDLSAIIALLAGLHPMIPVVLAILGALVVLGQAIVAVTPSKADDAAWAKFESIPLLAPVLKMLVAFAPIQKK